MAKMAEDDYLIQARDTDPLLVKQDQDGSISVTDVSVTSTSRTPAAMLQAKSDRRRRWRSIYVMYFTMFMGAITFSIILSSIYPYLQTIDKHVTTTFYGIVVASFSVGQLVASPLFGFLTDKAPVKPLVLVTLVICLVANVLYSYCGVVPKAGQYLLIVSRVLVGFSAGNAAISRAYIAAATFEEERVAAFAYISASQAIGFIVGPVLGLAFVPLKSTGWSVKAIDFHFNMYTGPGYLSAILAIINIVLIIFCFKDLRLRNRLLRRTDDPSHRLNRLGKEGSLSVTQSNVGINNDTGSPAPPAVHYDRVSVGVCVVLFFVILLAFAVYESIITPYSMDEFAWSKRSAILYNNIMFGALAIISIATFIGLKFLVKRVDERLVLVVGLIVTACGFLVQMPFIGDPPDIGILVIDPAHNATGDYSTGDISSLLYANDSVVHELNLTASTVPLGCRYPLLSWCPELPRLHLSQYIGGTVLTAIGYPSSYLMCYSIFSKAIGPFPQGMLMGILTATGSLARTVGPVFVTALYDHAGPQYTFGAVDVIMMAAIILAAIFITRLVPYGQSRSCPRLWRRNR